MTGLSRFGAEGGFAAFGRFDLSLRTRVRLGRHAARNGWA